MTFPSDAAESDRLYPATVPGRTLDLTIHREPHVLTIDADEFRVPQVLAVHNLRKVISVIGDLGGVGDLMAGSVDPNQVEGVLSALTVVFRALMPGESGRRFVERLNSQGRSAGDDVERRDGSIGRLAEDDPEPLDLMRQVLPALMWLLEVYGLRPTTPSSTSAATSNDGTSQNDGTSSGAGASLAESTSTS